jgi:hypothetical protein
MRHLGEGWRRFGQGGQRREQSRATPADKVFLQFGHLVHASRWFGRRPVPVLHTTLSDIGAFATYQGAARDERGQSGEGRKLKKGLLF